MIISHKHQFIFVKTRKTAGSTVEKLLYPYLGEFDVITGSERDGTPEKNTSITNGHLSWRQIETAYPQEWRDYYKFTVERNPWDKVVSSYFWHKLIKEERFGTMEFEEYMMTCELLPTDWNSYARGNQVMVDNVWFYENMGDMYDELNDLFGFDITQEDYTTTKCKSGIRQIDSYKELHNANTIDRVRELFSNEIKHLGYKYE
jgi:hypothetical protein